LSKWGKKISVGVGTLLLFSIPLLASVDILLAAHETDSARIEALERRLPYMEAKVASTLRDGASSPVSFSGMLQLRPQFHSFSGLADSSWLNLAQQGFVFNTDQPLIRLGMVVSPGRNSTAWATMGFRASFPGVNSYQFLNPRDPNNHANDIRGNWFYDFQHHSSGSSGRGVTVYEDMNAGFAIRTTPASFMLRMGSMNWLEASPLSIWGGTRRAFAWEYLPYEIEGPIAQRFSNNIASLEQVGRGVWNRRPFQGIDLSVIDLPWGLRGFFLYGVGSPFDRMHRYHIDMAVDRGYAGDNAGAVGSIIEAGIGDQYRQFLFYRLSKRMQDQDITFGINNGFMISRTDVVGAGYWFGASFNQKFDIGRLRSDWENTATGETVRIEHQTDLERVRDWNAADRNILSLGEGFIVEPNILSADVRGSIGSNFRFMLDVGASWVDTHFIRIDPDSYGTLARRNDPAFNIFADPAVGGDGRSGTQYNPGRILDTRTSTSAPQLAVYGTGTYNFPAIQTSLELFFAQDNFYSPFSFVNSTDAFWAFGSNMLGSGAFLNTEASPYSKNMRSMKLTLVPETPDWHGFLKFGYQINSQNTASRDLLALPYRLNGRTLQQALSPWYSKWGLGTLTEGHEFRNNQGGFSTNEGMARIGTFAKHRVNRMGDQSFTQPNAPHIGGLRGDFDGIVETFVPFDNPHDVIFNYFAGSTDISNFRDLRSIWNSGGDIWGDLMRVRGRRFEGASGNIGGPNTANTGRFENMIVRGINAANSGDGVRIVNGRDTSFVRFAVDDLGNLLVDPIGEGTSGILRTFNADGSFRSDTEVSVVSETGFVPVSQKRSFDFSVDFARNIARYVGYQNDLYISLYYQINGITRNFQPMAFMSDESNDVLLLSHYFRTEPTIGLTNRFFITTMFGFEAWRSGKTWIGEYAYMGGALNGQPNNGGLINVANDAWIEAADNFTGATHYTLTGVKRSNLATNDIAWGVGFNWDIVRRVSLHGRYSWLRHIDKNISYVDANGNTQRPNDFTGNVVSLELKAFF